MSGWKARIGYLSPSVFETPSDWDSILPRASRLSPRDLMSRLTRRKNSTKPSMLWRRAWEFSPRKNVMPFCWVALPWAPSEAMRRSRRWSQNYPNKVGLPISTGMNASVEALRHLKAKTIVIATAYMEKINQAVKRYYDDAGFEVAGIAGLEVKKTRGSGKASRLCFL